MGPSEGLTSDCPRCDHGYAVETVECYTDCAPDCAMVHRDCVPCHECRCWHCGAELVLEGNVARCGRCER